MKTLSIHETKCVAGAGFAENMMHPLIFTATQMALCTSTAVVLSLPLAISAKLYPDATENFVEKTLSFFS